MVRHAYPATILLLFAASAGSAAAGPMPLAEPRKFPVDTNAPIKQIGPDVFQIGSVQFDKSKKTIRFPAKVNMSTGAVEYLLVHSTGKVHESVLKTDVEPYQIHLAA